MFIQAASIISDGSMPRSSMIQGRIHISKELAQRAHTHKASDASQQIRTVNRVRSLIHVLEV